MGYTLLGANSVMINIHYVNAGSTALTPTVAITLKVAKPGVVKTHIGTLFLNQNPMNIPVTPMSSPMDSTKNWGGNPGAVSSDGSYFIYSSWSHMHKWSLKLTASTNGTVFYTETQWDSPNVFLHTGAATQGTASGTPHPISMPSTQGTTWTCSYYNDTSATLTFGDFANKNVMCIYLGQYYPADPKNPDVVDILN
jgi:hypothetical protein